MLEPKILDAWSRSHSRSLQFISRSTALVTTNLSELRISAHRLRKQ